MFLNHCHSKFYCEVDLPSSKSIHNRVAILKKLYNLNLKVKNPSNSDDSLLLDSLLISKKTLLNCKNAGTVLRFLTAYYSVQSKKVILTGDMRMQSRPIGDLVMALNQLGATIIQLKHERFPPLEISGTELKGDTVKINGSISSQFISALIMIGPYLPNGLTINIDGTIASKPYLDMTLNLMNRLGFLFCFKNKTIKLYPHQINSRFNTIYIEPDWSAVAFWFQIIANSSQGSVFIKRLTTHSLQGDSILYKWAPTLGLKLTQKSDGILIEKIPSPPLLPSRWDLSSYPDLAPSLIVMLSSQKQKATFTGLHTLKIKECNRILALQTELKKCRVSFTEEKDEWQLDASQFNLIENTEFENYGDHRIAMAFGCLSFIKPIYMKDPGVVTKSYPDFWQHLSLTQSYICKQ